MIIYDKREVKILKPDLNLNNIQDRIKYQKSEDLRKYLRTHLVDMREAVRVSREIELLWK